MVISWALMSLLKSRVTEAECPNSLFTLLQFASMGRPSGFTVEPSYLPRILLNSLSTLLDSPGIEESGKMPILEFSSVFLPPPDKDCSVVIVILTTGRSLITGASVIASGTTMQLEQETSIPSPYSVWDSKSLK